jgi:hypothetical protein
MAQPTYTSQHYDTVLSNISVAYIQDPANYIARQIFPIVGVEKQSGIYFTYDKDAWLRDEAKKRAPGTESAGSGYKTSQDNYFCDVWALHKDVDEQVIANATPPLDPKGDAARYIASRLLLSQELDFANTYFKAGVWANDFTGVAASPTGNQFIQFNDYTNSDPILAVDTMKETVSSKTGFEVNTMVMGKLVWNQLKNHPDILDRVKYTDARAITTDILARYFEVDRVIVAKGLVNTAKEGAAASTSYIYGKGLFMCYSAPSAGLLNPSAGYTFSWNGYDGMMAATSELPMPLIKSTRIETEAAWVNKVVAPDLGVFAASVVA